MRSDLIPGVILWCAVWYLMGVMLCFLSGGPNGKNYTKPELRFWLLITLVAPVSIPLMMMFMVGYSVIWAFIWAFSSDEA